MKTIGTRKRERRAAAAAAEQAQSVASSVPANQMRKPQCRGRWLKSYLFQYERVLQISHTNRQHQIWNRCTVPLKCLPSVTKKIRMCRHRHTRKRSSNYRNAPKYPLSLSQHVHRKCAKTVRVICLSKLWRFNNSWLNKTQSVYNLKFNNKLFILAKL